MEMNSTQLAKIIKRSSATVSYFMRDHGYVPIRVDRPDGRPVYVYSEEACAALVNCYTKPAQKEPAAPAETNAAKPAGDDMSAALMLLTESVDKCNANIDRIAFALERLASELCAFPDFYWAANCKQIEEYHSATTANQSGHFENTKKETK